VIDAACGGTPGSLLAMRVRAAGEHAEQRRSKIKGNVQVGLEGVDRSKGVSATESRSFTLLLRLVSLWTLRSITHGGILDGGQIASNEPVVRTQQQLPSVRSLSKIQVSMRY